MTLRAKEDPFGGGIRRRKDWHGNAVRLRDRRRRLGGQRAREPALAGSRVPSTRPRGGPAGLVLGPPGPHARGARLPDRQSLLRLAVRVRAGALYGRPAGLPRAREGAGWLEQRQRDDLPARQSAGLRALGLDGGHGVLGLRAL